MSSPTPLADTADWYPTFRRRHLDTYRAAGVPVPAAELLVDQLLDPAHGWTAAAITDPDGQRIGQVVVGAVEREGRTIGRIVDLWTAPDTDPDGAHRHAAHAWARRWCEEHAAERVTVRLAEPHPSFTDYPVRSQVRFKAIGSAPGPVDGVTARPMTEAEYPEWVREEQDGYVADIVRSGSRTAEEARTQAEQEFRELLPQGLGTPATTVLVIEAEGSRVGVAWLNHGYLPGVSYLYSVAVDPTHRGRGYGRAAMAVSDAATLAAGDRALMFNVFGGNDVAMGLYTSAGYHVLEESRSVDLG
ncbi:hypothetical protein GCM10010441_24890 [Kitasatospora paracochleata]|uniref:Ribosomal protein S18 acetylase RimI-like enzyme n=1 Tax=Kitasatospora paracochleata TaxID=58354 RepID=A0ABT1J0X5_9ACTN|nr:GNAT family N-acetyltransferase [Kitasatospora paracochleata]MCP2311043.1 ribosomal protein S18 acetylase RimI-like enzyme [Kitasatospora paracochleata]